MRSTQDVYEIPGCGTPTELVRRKLAMWKMRQNWSTAAGNKVQQENETQRTQPKAEARDFD